MIADLRERWPNKLVLKGVLRADDAEKAASMGVDAIVVSNHGGRSLDGSIAAADALPEIVSAVGGKVEILLDSGVRRGSDVVRALALGAKGVLVGRAPLYGLACGGEEGVSRALDLLKAETVRTMAMLGARNIGEVDDRLLS
jgi:isopentenyl diphosphate isomerase/L-lactate dehydrogenase-like FMN-dependent dehydrogenase